MRLGSKLNAQKALVLNLAGCIGDAVLQVSEQALVIGFECLLHSNKTMNTITNATCLKATVDSPDMQRRTVVPDSAV